jgi:large subunit ribosomal protein L21
MYAVIETGGSQFNVEEGKTLTVPRINGTVGDTVNIDKVLLISGGSEPVVGTPYIEGASVDAELISQNEGNKVLVYKYKRRTKYRRTRGHRQQVTELKIKKINAA